MAFTPPTTVASLANTGYLAVFFVGVGAGTTITYTAMVEIKSFTNNLAEVAEVQCTTLVSPGNTEESLPGMIKPGTIEITGNFIGDPTQLNLTTLMQTATDEGEGNTFPFKVTAAMQRGAKTYTLTGQCWVKSYKNGPFEGNKAIDYQAQFQLTGPYAEAVA